MIKTMWLMEGLSSQRDIIAAIVALRNKKQLPIQIIASHSDYRHEILALADYAYIEPKKDDDRLVFMQAVIEKHNVAVVHAGRNCPWFEHHRILIEAMGVSLVTGAKSADIFALANDKVKFAQYMEQHNLPVVPSIQVNTVSELRGFMSHSPFPNQRLCIKPVTGIYGMGFWQLDPTASPLACFKNPDARKTHPDIYLQALEYQETFEPMVLMPYLPGPERSVDMLVENGEVIAAVGRRKEGSLQYMEQEGSAFELAKACAECMQADGLINVQTRNDQSGKPVLLEINLRPSGGIGYTLHSGINLPALLALRQLKIADKKEAREMGINQFSSATVRSVTDVIAFSDTPPNILRLN